jgi:hypothetical protein
LIVDSSLLIEKSPLVENRTKLKIKMHKQNYNPKIKKVQQLVILSEQAVSQLEV